MRERATSVAIACLLPIAFGAGCSVLGKAGVKVNGKNVGSDSSGSGAPTPAAGGTTAPSAPAVAAGPAPAVKSAPAPVTEVPTVEADGRPSYCKPNKTYFSSIDDELERYRRPYDSWEVMVALAEETCEKHKKQEDKDKLARHLAEFKAHMGLNDTEVSQLMSVFIDKREAQKHWGEFCDTLTVEDEDLATEREFGYIKAMKAAVGCNGSGGYSDYDWPDQDFIARGLDIGGCYAHVNDRIYGGSSKPSPYDMLNYAQCNAMATGYQTDKAVAAVRANNNWGVVIKSMLIGRLHRIGAHKKNLDPIFGKLAKKDEIYEEFIYTAPANAYAAWNKQYAQNKAQLDELHHIVAHGTKKYIMKKVGDCSEKYFGQLQKIVSKKKVEEADDLKDALSDPVSGMVAAAYAFCEAAQKNEVVAQYYKGSTVNFSLPLGPRDAARKAAVNILAANRDEVPGARDMSSLGRSENGFSFPSWSTGPREQRKAVIKSVKVSGDTVTVSFKKESWKEPVYACKETNRIDGFRDGKVIYRQKCKKTGTRKVTSKEQPVELPLRHAQGLKAGQFLVFSRSYGKGPSMPLRVYKSNKEEKLLGVLGLRF